MLDEVERNGAALIERGDVQFVITLKRRATPRRTRTPTIEIADPAVAAGEWRWDWTAAGLRFKGVSPLRPTARRLP